mmetsp:Transcript_38146/g.114040  ORF Transcript_38146/g.114040 Transcript_38146/m.114040 type:complete len:210 (-) Transcript_38146:491-1120(-)
MLRTPLPPLRLPPPLRGVRSSSSLMRLLLSNFSADFRNDCASLSNDGVLATPSRSRLRSDNDREGVVIIAIFAVDLVSGGVVVADFVGASPTFLLPLVVPERWATTAPTSMPSSSSSWFSRLCCSVPFSPTVSSLSSSSSSSSPSSSSHDERPSNSDISLDRRSVSQSHRPSEDDDDAPPFAPLWPSTSTSSSAATGGRRSRAGVRLGG